MDDFSIRGSVPSTDFNQPQTPLDQLESSLRMPGDETERFNRLKEMFQNLPAGDAENLFHELEANKDPLAQQFNVLGSAKDELLSILQSKFAASSETPPFYNVEEQTKQPQTPAKESAKVKQLDIDGATKQKELDRQLSAGKAQAQEFPADARNDKLSAINVHRQVGDDMTITNFPNGVKLIKKSETGKFPSQDLISNEVSRGTVHKKDTEVEYEVVAPPGGKVQKDKNGELIVSDAKGKEVGRMDKDGNLQVKTKRGDYKQDVDGKLHFSTKEKMNPQAFKKGGPISPGDFENYGISTDGHTIRFPNGVEYTPQNLQVPDTNDGIKHTGFPQNPVHVPEEVGRIQVFQTGEQRYPEIITARTIDGNPLVHGDFGNVHIPGDDGEFVIDPKGNVTFHPRGT